MERVAPDTVVFSIYPTSFVLPESENLLIIHLSATCLQVVVSLSFSVLPVNVGTNAGTQLEHAAVLHVGVLQVVDVVGHAADTNPAVMSMAIEIIQTWVGIFIISFNVAIL
jgi:hypothetical protein